MQNATLQFIYQLIGSDALHIGGHQAESVAQARYEIRKELEERNAAQTRALVKAEKAKEDTNVYSHSSDAD